MLENYVLYLKFLELKLAKFFESQKPYIFCKKGCSKCCQNAEFPYSSIEVEYLIYGFSQLENSVKKSILKNINDLNEQKNNFTGEKFLYACPFLINNSCSLYEYRGIICRTFGLIYTGKDGAAKIPFCSFEGLNYSNVIEPKTQKISAKKVKELGFKDDPLSFNISYKFLTDACFEEQFNFKFGEKKALIDWFNNIN